jgi:hypothetical protein
MHVLVQHVRDGRRSGEVKRRKALGGGCQLDNRRARTPNTNMLRITCARRGGRVTPTITRGGGRARVGRGAAAAFRIWQSCTGAVVAARHDIRGGIYLHSAHSRERPNDPCVHNDTNKASSDPARRDADVRRGENRGQKSCLRFAAAPDSPPFHVAVPHRELLLPRVGPSDRPARDQIRRLPQPHHYSSTTSLPSQAGRTELPPSSCTTNKIYSSCSTKFPNAAASLPPAPPRRAPRAGLRRPLPLRR